MIRNAAPKDVPVILQLIKALATFEREPDAVKLSEDELHANLFKDKVCDAFVYEVENRVVGFALWYISYSTWKGKCVYLEDLYVLDAYRQLGIGQKLFDAVVAKARELNVRRMDWQVLEWNTPAIRFFEKNNAILDPEWINGRFFFEEN